MTKVLRRHIHTLWAVLVTAIACSTADAAVTVLGVQYQPDQLFPEYDCIWHDRNYPTSCQSNIPGCNVHVFVKNTGGGSVTVTDATVKGYSLESILKEGDIIGARSIYYTWDIPPADIVTGAGEPVWYKASPKTIPAGGVGQVVVRLRYIPADAAVAVGVVTSGGTVTTNVTKDANAPQLARVGFVAGLTNVTLHWRRTNGAAPVSVWMDGTNVTSNTTTVGDPNLSFAASVINLAAPLANMSYHVFQGVYADGKTATAGLRAWANKFIYATYGTFEGYDGHEWVIEAAKHGVNNCQLGGMGSYLATGAGQADAATYEFGYTTQDIGHLSAADPDMWFLNDEPDAQEDNQANTHCGTGLKIPCGSGNSIGILTMFEIAHGEELQAVRPLTPTTVNMNGTLKPGNYMGWGQAVDILQVDPYYQRRLSDTYWYHNPEWIPLYKKATYVYAVSRAVAAAAEPNPSNVLLYSCEWKDVNLDKIWPFPTPECKRIEVYYTLAGGATGIGYWWSNPNYPSKGLGGQNTPAERALWKEMGLLGNEIKTARQLLVTSTPVNLPMTQSANVWVRTLASGTDSILLLIVNDNYFNDIAGCHYTNVANATVTATLPSWLQSPMAFEIAAGGLKPVNTVRNGNQLQINLGTLSLTRMIVLTRNPGLPLKTQQWYDQKVRWGICDIAPELCGNSAPIIAVPPQSQAVLLGANATFMVAASGTPSPTYQWRFNNANLAGATTASYTRVNAQGNHAGGYSVVVGNSGGSVTSVVATLTVSTNGIAPTIFAPPLSQMAAKGDNATFNVTANGTDPLSYQWRFNNANLAGATTSSYTRFNAQTNDAGNYAVVITNAAGAITSAPASLTVTVPILCVPAGLVNGDFEGGNSGGVATGWTAYEVNAPTIKVWSMQTALPPVASSQYQQIQAYNAALTASAGVRQNVTGCVVGATYQIAGWYRSNSDFGRARVRVSPSASTDWNTAVDLNPVADYGSTTVWATFSGTVVATGTSMTLWLDGRTISGTSGKVGCFDLVTVTCLGPTAPTVPPVLQYQQQGNDLVFRWPTNQGNYSLIATTNVSGAVWSGVLPSATVVNGTNVVTNAISGQRKFFRLMQQ